MASHYGYILETHLAPEWNVLLDRDLRAQPKDEIGHLYKISWKKIIIGTMLVTLLPLFASGKTEGFSQNQEEELGRYFHQELLCWST